MSPLIFRAASAHLNITLKLGLDELADGKSFAAVYTSFKPKWSGTATLGDTRAQRRVFHIMCGLDDVGSSDSRGRIKNSAVLVGRFPLQGSLERVWAQHRQSRVFERATLCRFAHPGFH